MDIATLSIDQITADLAAASGGTFYLLDMAPAPDPANADIRRVVDDRDGLKRDIFERLKNAGERATPAVVERELANLERLNSALAAMEAVQGAGGCGWKRLSGPRSTWTGWKRRQPPAPGDL